MHKQISLFDELIIDNFAGGGGASTGIELATGKPVDIAINHDAGAIAMHKINHPHTQHFCESVWDVDSRKVTRGRRVGLAWFSPDCFPAGTMILTSNGYRAIETIREGDMVLTHTGRYCRVYATMKVAKDVCRVKIQGSPTITTTAEHPFYARSMKNIWNNARRNYTRTLEAPSWVEAKDLRVGVAEMNAAGGDRHFCATPCEFPYLPIPPVGGRGLPIDERLMWLAGRYVGDGWTRLGNGRAELVIICGKSEADDLFVKLNVWKRAGNRSLFNELSWHMRETKTSCQLSTSHKGLVEWLRNEFNHGASNKSFPAWAFGCNEKLRRALLDGYVSADGNISVIKNVEVTETVTVSPALAFSTKALAESLGFTTKIFEPKMNRDVIEGRKVNVKPSYRVRWRTEPLRSQTVRDSFHNWSRVQRTEETTGEMEVFNISVEEDESYVANGIVVHNCKHFSKAKGGKPVNKEIRGLAWVAVRWAATVRPRVIILENVEEFKTWCPVKDGQPIKSQVGRTFNSFVNALRYHGYAVDFRELKACDYGAPTIRKRFFLIARCDGRPIEWPKPTHGDPTSDAVRRGILKPWRTAAEIIDWTLPCPSIFATSKEIFEQYGLRAVRPLADATLRRIARGLQKFVFENPEPFIVDFKFNNAPKRGGEPLGTITSVNGYGLVAPYVVPIGYGERSGQAPRINRADEPLSTVVSACKQYVVAPTLIQYHGEQSSREVRGQDLSRPLLTADGANRYGLVTAFLSKYYSGGHQGSGNAPTDPINTVTAIDHNALVTSHLTIFRNNTDGQEHAEPLKTVMTSPGHFGEVRAFLVKYYGSDGQGNEQSPGEPLHTITTKDRFGIVTIHGEEYAIADIGLRMLTPRELFNAQGFPEDYVIDTDPDGKPIPKSAQVARCGNAVPPPFAEALVRANLPELCGGKIETMADLKMEMAG